MPQPPAGDVPAADLFTQWIKDAHKEKWSILYDTGGRRYGIETTNHADCMDMYLHQIVACNITKVLFCV